MDLHQHQHQSPTGLNFRLVYNLVFGMAFLRFYFFLRGVKKNLQRKGGTYTGGRLNQNRTPMLMCRTHPKSTHPASGVKEYHKILFGKKHVQKVLPKK
jgi:hypothetical protein